MNMPAFSFNSREESQDGDSRALNQGWALLSLGPVPSQVTGPWSWPATRFDFKPSWGSKPWKWLPCKTEVLPAAPNPYRTPHPGLASLSAALASHPAGRPCCFHAVGQGCNHQEPRLHVVAWCPSPPVITSVQLSGSEQGKELLLSSTASDT